MPYKSDAQRRYFNANREELEAQGVDVDEWNESSKGKKLPEKVKEEKKAFAPMINNMAQWMRQNFRATPGPGVNLGTNGAGQQAMQGGQSPYGMMQQGLEAGVPRMLGTNGAGQQFNQSPYNLKTFSGILPNLQGSFGNMLGTNGMGQRATQAGSASPYSAISQAGSLGKQFNPYGTGMGFNGGLGGGLNGSSVGGNYGQAAGTNAAAVPGASQMKLGEDQQDTRPSAFSVIPGIGGFISGAVKENPGVKSRFGSSLGEGVTGLAGGLLGGTLLGKLLGHAAYGRFMSKIPASQRGSLATDLMAEHMVKAPAQGYGGLMGGIFGTNTGSRLFRDMTQPSEKQSAEKAAFAALKNLLQRFAKPGVAAKSVGEEAAAALGAPVGRRPRFGVPNVDAAESALKPRYSLPEAKNLLPGFLDDINSSIPKPRLGVPTQQPYKAQDLASIGHDYSKLKSLGGENLPIVGKMLKRRYPLPEARDLRPEFWESNRNFNPRFGLPVVEGELKAIGHDYRDMSKNLPGSPLPIIGKMAADQLGKIAAGRCWEGYEPVPGKKPYSDGSCQPKGEKSKAKEKKAFADLAREYNAMQSGLTGADLGMRIVPGALAGGVVGGVKGLMEDPGYDDRTGKKRSRLVNILKNSLGGAVGGGVVGHLMGAPAMQFGVRKGYELGDGISRYLSDARDRVEKLSADKRASLGKLLAGGGIGGALGTLLGRYTGYNAGYNKGSSIGEHESLLNLLRGMHGVMRQGAESNLDLKELVNKKASSGCGCGSGEACQCGDDQNNRASKCSECGEVNCQCQKSASDIAFLGKLSAAQEKMAFRLLPGRRQQAAPQPLVVATTKRSS